MKFTFEGANPSEVLEKIKGVLDGRKLDDMVSFKMEGNDLVLTISKLGKSVVHFKHDAAGDGFSWTTVKEKIALSHKAFKGEVMGKLVKVVEKVGGNAE